MTRPPWPLVALISRLLALLAAALWPMWKWLLNKGTGRCELLRIVLKHPAGAERFCKLEGAIRASGCPAVRSLLAAAAASADADSGGGGGGSKEAAVAEAAAAVAAAKRVEPAVYPQFEAALAEAVSAALAHDRLVACADAERRVAFDAGCGEHEAKLARLWTALRPGEPLKGRVSKQWSEIGFQGDDPQTDFRGMGMLGLDQLLFFATRCPRQAAQALAQSQHPVHGYPFAVASINISHLVWRLLFGRRLRNHFYNLSSYEMDDLHRLFCCVFVRFAEFWQRQGASVMEFNRVKAKFKRLLKREAASYDCLFQVPACDTDGAWS